MRPAERPDHARRLRVAAALCGLAWLTGCGSLPQPWEKGVLAKPAMAFDSDPLEARFSEHIYTSKEAASGGGGVGGAGCGCN
jgi:Domain of unknown function (DUF4266)